MDEESAKIGTAVEHSLNNKYFVEFTEHQKKMLEKNQDAFGGENPEDDGLFLAYMTRRYFRDNIFMSAVKAVIGMAIWFVSYYLITKGAGSLRIGAIVLFILGLVMVPSGIFFMFTNLSCFKHYNDYVTGRDDPFMDKVIKFYNDARK